MIDEASEADMENTTNISMNAIALPLRDKKESFTFHSVEDLEDFIETERKHWDWLATSPAPWNVLSNHLKAHVVEVILNILTTISSHWKNNNEEALNKQISLLKDTLSSVSFPFSCRKVGKAIACEARESNIVGINMLYLCSVPKDEVHINDVVSEISKKIRSIVQFPPNGRLPNITKAFLESEVYRLKANRILTKVELIGFDCDVEGVTKRLGELSSEIVNIQGQCQESATELEHWKMTKKADYDLWVSSKKGEYEEWADSKKQESNQLAKKFLRKMVSLKTAYIRRSSETLRESEETVSNAKDVYLSQVELDAAVTYWDGKKTAHNTSKNAWLKAVVALLITTSIAPFLIINFLPVTELAEEKLLLNVLNPITLITSLLVISLLSFSIRLCSRQFSTQQHLFLEAEERKTMLKTYLALMNEGKLVEQEDRKVALDALFRPAKTGIVSEQGNIVPTDSVVKIIERQPVAAKP